MLAVRHHPELVTPELLAWARPQVRYDAEGHFSRWLVEGRARDGGRLPGPLERIAAAVAPGMAFDAVALRGYRDGTVTTPCHTDARAAGLGVILSLGPAARTFRLHRVPPGTQATAGCGDPFLDVVLIQCVPGTVVLMDEAFQATWHHQVAPDENVTEERLSLVFRARPGKRVG